MKTILLLGGDDHGTYVPISDEDSGCYASAVQKGLTYMREESTHAGPDVAFPDGFSRDQKIEALKRWMSR